MTTKEIEFETIQKGTQFLHENGKVYVACYTRLGGDNDSIQVVVYRSIRDGKPFGATRNASLDQIKEIL
jgi:hypothetical protein